MSKAEGDCGLLPGLESITAIQKETLCDGLYVRFASTTPLGPFDTPVLFVHGAFHGWWAYRIWMSFFAYAGWRTAAVSLRGHTDSAPLPIETLIRTTLSDYANDVSSVMGLLGSRCVLVGHSMGGLVAQMVAERRSDEVVALVLLASVGPGQLGPYGELVHPDEPVSYREEYIREAQAFDVTRETFETVRDLLTRESPVALNECRSGAIQVDRSRIGCPVLVLRGDQDSTKAHSSERIASFYGCESVLLHGVGHDIMFERSAFANAIRLNHWLIGHVGISQLSPRSLINRLSADCHTRC